ncbi:hypothetical protein D3C86_808680 [compost metagenome]
MAEKFVEVLDKTVAFGIVISSIFGVLTRVTKAVFSITSPLTSPIFIKSPILKGRIYVITKPATILAIALEEPIENKIPTKTVIPLKAGESDPGKYGKIITNIKA